MDQKQFWITVIVALVVAVVVSFVMGAGSPNLAPRTSLSSAPINANSCNADSLCEVTSLSSMGDINLSGDLFAGNTCLTCKKPELIRFKVHYNIGQNVTD